MKKYEWMRNDTAAIMFSAIDDSCNSRIFRISAVVEKFKFIMIKYS